MKLARFERVKFPTFKSDIRPDTHPQCPVRKNNRSRLLVVLTIVSLTGTMGQRFYNQPKLDVGTVAPITMKAPNSANVIDHKTTEDRRKDARIGAIPVLMRDDQITQEVMDKLGEVFRYGDQLRQMVGEFPFISPSILSTNVQFYLWQCPEKEWGFILNYLSSPQRSLEKLNQSDWDVLFNNSQDSVYSFRQTIIKQGILQLKLYQKTVSKQQFQTVIEQITKARYRYFSTLHTISQSTNLGEGKFYDPSLFNLSDDTWKKTQEGISLVAQKMLAQGISPGLPREILHQGIQAQIEDEVPPGTQPLALSILLGILQPNLIRDEMETRQLSELAAQKVKPVTVKIEKGEIIVREGQMITQETFVLLDHFGLSRREINWKGLLGFVILVSGSLGVIWLVEQRFHSGLRRRDQLLLLLLTLSPSLITMSGIPSTTLPTIGILISTFYGVPLGLTIVGLLSGLLPLGMSIDLTSLLPSVGGGLLGALMAGNLRSREELALLGVSVGLTQAIIYLIVSLILSSTATSIWYFLLGTAALQGIMGLASGVLALGVSPYLEHLFDLITPIRLAELANPNRPLLKRLASEAPGTFQHTLFVASLAEAAARELNCNVELVRTGTLYHDIGKMHDPLAFCENLMGGTNKHDEIDDPWKSAEIIKKHVSEGIAMAKKYRLPKAIRAFIPEHQGTMLIAYFYHYAQQKMDEHPERKLNESDFRYDGPIPQSRETGIVMLADSCEAALRSLKDGTHEEALQMVNRILRARWQDQQLLASGLTREDLSVMAEVFVRVWEQFNHKRVAYPKAVISPRSS